MSRPGMQILERLAEHARVRPSHGAVSSVNTQTGATSMVTCDALFRDVCAVAGLVGEHTDPGGVVALAGPSGAEFVAAYLGTLGAGRIIHPVPQHSTANELSGFLRATGAGLMIGTEAACEVARREGRRAIRFDELPRRIERDGMTDVGDGPGLYLPSSGTTGLPKIAVRSRRSLDAVAANVARAASLTPDDVVLAAVPMSHSYGMENGLLGPVWAGARIHVLDRGGEVDTGDLPRQLEQAGITVFPAVPFMVDMLAKLSDGPGPSRLRLVYTAGSPLPRGVAAEFARRYGVGVGQLYGATEVGSVTFAEPGEFEDSACVGHALDGVSILILDADSPDVSRPLTTGEEGQVAIRATSMLSHYLGGDRSDPAFLDGYFLTGDLGRVDDLGALTITGRLKLLIDVGGFKVNPLEVERTLLEHPSVGEVVVLPVKVSDTVSRLRALIAPRGGEVPIEEVRAFAKQRLSPHKVPRIFEVVPSLPKSATGKVLRRELETSP